MRANNLARFYHFHLCFKFVTEPQGTAVKTVRLHDIAALEPLLDDGDLDLSVLVLLRDPRAILASRLQIAAQDAQKDGWKIDADEYLADLQTECDQLTRGHQWLQNSKFGTKVKFIKFEDGVTEPQKLEREVAEFVDFQTERTFTMEEKQEPNKYQKSVQGAYLNHKNDRDPSQVLSSWRKTLSPHLVERVERECGALIALFGYKKK
jgi:hypothetical protein